MEAAEECSRKGQRVSAKQLDIMISYLETDEDLRIGKLNPQLSKADRKRKWQELTDVLNAEGTALKTPEQWRKCWHDQKGYARNKAIKIKTSDKLPSEALTPIEERILKLIGMSTIVEQPTIVNISRAHNPPAHIIEDTIVIESESASALRLKQEISPNENTKTAKEATPCEVPSPPELSVPSLPETTQSAFVAINLQQPSQPLGAYQSGFLPVILNQIEPEKPPSSKDFREVNETLKQQLGILKRIAEANEQIANACMIIANKTEERTKELTLQNELIQDINQTLQHVLKKQKTNEDGDFL